MRVYELAKELKITSKDLVSFFQDAGISSVSSHMSVLSDDAVTQAKKHYASSPAVQEKKPKPLPVEKQVSVAVKKEEAFSSNKKLSSVQEEAIVINQKNSVHKSIEKKETHFFNQDPHKDEKNGQVLASPKEVPEDVQEFLATFDTVAPVTKGQEKFTKKFLLDKPAARPRRGFGRKRNKGSVQQSQEVKPVTEITLEGGKKLCEVAELMSKSSGELILALLKNGIACNRNNVLSLETIRSLGQQFGITIHVKLPVKIESTEPMRIKKTEGSVVRWPIVVIMGHVDHGKTTLLDYILKTNVAAREKGGITQHISAYEVTSKHGKIVFLDTPGHEAFSYLRRRGARVTDLAILVVAADDGIKPQTLEAIKHAKEAEVPIIVAINKIDKAPASGVETVKRQLAQHDLTPEDWGGQTVCVPVSAKTGQGVDELLELIILQAQLMDLKATPELSAKAFVIESRLDKGYGPVATVICTEGTLKQGDYFTCGSSTGRVRLLIDSYGKRITQAETSIPVQVVGFNNFASMGDWLTVVTAEQYSKVRSGREKDGLLVQASAKAEFSIKGKDSASQSVINLMIKTDTRGSREAIIGSLEKLLKERKDIDCTLNVVTTGVGDISENDVEHAANTDSTLIGFHVKVEKNAQLLAKAKNVDIQLYEIIYQLIEHLEKTLESKKKAKISWKKSGEAVVRKVFNIKGVGVIAGCYLQDGICNRTSKIACVRNGKIVGESKIKSLERDKKSVKEVHAGYEFGFIADSFHEWQVDDTVHCFTEIRE